ncbi:MAG TPA: hypothetical protein VKK79_25285 [Candidatus Lokiarchaeia archaeon]|nr:hypothetical protein [Candidatus Lokiarchaeia archaeon]
MVLPKKEAWIKPEHQEILVQGLYQFRDRILAFAGRFVEEWGLRMKVERAAQFVILLLLSLLFGLVPLAAFSALESDAFGEVRAYVANLHGKFPGRSTASAQMGRILYLCDRNPPLCALLEGLASALQDFYYAAVGNAAQAMFKAVLETTRAQVTAPAECFVGIAKASELFPSLGAAVKGRLLPFFNAWAYKQAQRVTSTAELVGALKKPCFEAGRMHFTEAGELGFVAGPPETKKFYANFQYIESHASPAWNLASKELARLGVLDLTAVTVDGTNVPVDRRDTTGSVGTGSRGTFSGHKASVGASANCLPVSGVVAGGRASDVSLLEDTLAPVEDLAREVGQDTFVDIFDGGYSFPDVVDRVEAGGAVPFVDLNPRNSELLQDLKDAANALKDLSKKAVKNGLTLEGRKAWLGEARATSEGLEGRVPVAEKKGLLKRILRNLANKARRHGLAPAEQRQEKRLRKAVMKARHAIMARGTPDEKRVGLLVAAFGTIEWYLVYFLRGQNEGINGLLKKRGALIGDGQHTSWMVGQGVIRGRVRGDLAGICFAALVKVRVTGRNAHPMRAAHNWSRRPKVFWFIFVVRLCR